MTIAFTDGVKGEIIFMSIPAELNYRYMIDPNNYKNSLSHNLYDLRRTEGVVKLFFPKRIYGVKHDNSNIARIANAINSGLRHRNNI